MITPRNNHRRRFIYHHHHTIYHQTAAVRTTPRTRPADTRHRSGGTQNHLHSSQVSSHAHDRTEPLRHGCHTGLPRTRQPRPKRRANPHPSRGAQQGTAQNTPAQRRKNTVHTKKITTGGTPQANALKKTKKNLTEKRTPCPETPERRAESEKRHTQNKKHHGKKIPHTLITRKNVLRKTLSCNIFVINSINIYYDGRRKTTTKNQNKQPNNPRPSKAQNHPSLPALRSSLPPTGKPSHP